MRDNNKDLTLERNYIQKWRFLIHEYQLVKAGKHPRFRFVQDFYSFHGTSRQTFAKYYNRFLLSPSDDSFLPRHGSPAAPYPSSSRRSSTNALTVPTVTRSMPYSNPSLNTTPLSHPPSTPSPDATVSIGADAAIEAQDHQDPGRRAGPPGQPPPQPGYHRG